jgi:hypothetical protein
MNVEVLIDIASAAEGMVLARQLLDDSGGMLLPQGSELTAASLASLRRRGVAQRAVLAAAPEPEPDSAALLAERARQCERLAHLFRASRPDDASALLLARLLRYRKGEPQ